MIEPPPPLPSDGKPAFTTGPQPPLAPPREEAPPPVSADEYGTFDQDDDIPF
jgi:hypothetical protein